MMNVAENISVFNESDQDDDDDLDVTFEIPSPIRFWILLVLGIPSVLCSLMVLWSLISNRKYRQSLNYRAVIVQLIAGLIYLLVHFPIYLNYLRLGYVSPQTPAMCQFWWFVGDGFSDSMTILMAWSSFERHMFIFHDHWASTRRKRMLRHYLPISLVILYSPVYYLIVMAFPPCENTYDYKEKLCASSCLYKNKALGLYDTLFNDITATLLIAIFCVSLIVRVLWHSYIRHQRRIHWYKHRRLIIILLSISFIYLAFNLPMMILELLELSGQHVDMLEYLDPCFDFLNYFVFIIYPWICLATMFPKFQFRQNERVAGTAEIVMTQRTRSKAPTVN